MCRLLLASARQNLSRWYDLPCALLTHPLPQSTHLPPTGIKQVSPMAWSKVDLLKAQPNDVYLHGGDQMPPPHMGMITGSGVEL